MLDLRLIRETPELVEHSLRARGSKADLSVVVGLDEQRRALLGQVEELRAQRNQLSAEIGPKAKAGDDITELKATVGEVKTAMESLESQLEDVDARLQKELLGLPNIVQPGVPQGGEDEGDVLRTVGDKPTFDFPARDHLDIATALDVVDMERGARTSGSRFAYLLGDAVRLQYALVQFALERLTSAGFLPVVPPVLVREESMWGTGFFPTDAGQIYRIPEENHDLFLVGTSEVPLAALHADEILDPEQLPLRYVGISSCFRREAGAAGKDTRGIFRVHQFDKVEMFSFTEPDPKVSRDEHEYILAQEEALIQDLELPYQVVNIAAGDLGASASQKFDIEVWLPGQGRYRELTSCSNCTDYQARRLKARVRRDKGTEIVHTLNGTAIAIGRMLVAIMENHQQADGTVRVPEALHRFGAPDVIGHARTRPVTPA
jgi:seryl-tRNA synthetase